MDNYRLALMGAVESYHNWLSKKNVDYHPAASIAELRGIFYNKLIATLKEHGSITGYGIRKCLFPTDFCIRHESNWSICGITLVTDPEHIYHNTERKGMLINVQEALKSIDSNIHYDAFEWRLEKIVKSLKF